MDSLNPRKEENSAKWVDKWCQNGKFPKYKHQKYENYHMWLDCLVSIV